MTTLEGNHPWEGVWKHYRDRVCPHYAPPTATGSEAHYLTMCTATRNIRNRLLRALQHILHYLVLPPWDTLTPEMHIHILCGSALPAEWNAPFKKQQYILGRKCTDPLCHHDTPTPPISYNRNRNPTNRNYLDICFSSSQNNRNSLAWVLVALVLSFFINPIGASDQAWGTIDTIRGLVPAP